MRLAPSACMMETVTKTTDPHAQARREVAEFMASIDPHRRKEPWELLAQRGQLERQLGRFAGAAAHEAATDAEIAALVQLKLDVLNALPHEADRACLMHLVVPHRVSGPETRKVCDRIMDSIKQMQTGEAQVNALIRYVFTVPLDGFPSGKKAPSPPLAERVARFAFRKFFGAEFPPTPSRVEGAPPPDWLPPGRGTAHELLRGLTLDRHDIAVALDLAGKIPPPYPSEDPVSAHHVADVFSARLPYHPAMGFDRRDYLTACQDAMGIRRTPVR